MNFKSPSQNSPFLPAIILVAHWVFTKAFLLLGLKYLSPFVLMGPSFIVNSLLYVLSLFSLLVMASFLWTKKYKLFLKSFITLLFVASVLVLIDTRTLQFMHKHTYSNLAKSMTSDDLKPVAETILKRFVNTTPQKHCSIKNQSCHYCLCPEGTELVIKDEKPLCFFYKAEANQIELSMDFIPAPCSKEENKELNQSVPTVESEKFLKPYAIYRTKNEELQSCDEYLTWGDWDLQNAKIHCEYDKKYSCQVLQAHKCTTQWANTLCEKKPEFFHVSYRRVQYVEEGEFAGFNFQEDCSFN